jgi:SAM-dependent methyltransferase
VKTHSTEVAHTARERLYASYGGCPGQDTPTVIGQLHYYRRFVRLHFPALRTSEIVDLGAGGGGLLLVARDLGYTNLQGVDRSGSQVHRSLATGQPLVVQGDALEFLRRLPTASKDVVVLFDVIEHLTLDELLLLLDEIHRILRSGGNLLLHTVNAGSPFFGRIRYGDLTHESAFTASSLRQTLSVVGFAKVDFHEDVPTCHSWRGCVRYLLWQLIRAVLAFYLTVETGGAREAILSQGFVAVARR